MPFFSTNVKPRLHGKMRHFAVGLGATLCVLLAGLPTRLHGQITEFSPYSRNGLGLLNPGTSTGLLGQGGSAIASTHAGFVNTENPASIVGLVKTTFEVGGAGTLQQLKVGDESANGQFGNTSPVSLVIKRQGGHMAYNLGLAPFSTSGFAATSTYTADGIGLVRETYDGTGGLSQLQLGAARSFYRNAWQSIGPTDSLQIRKQALYLGARLRYVFGQIQRTTRLDILDPTFLDNRTQTTDQHRSAGLELGLQYELLLRSRYNAQQEFERSTSLRIGAIYAPEARLSTDHIRIVETTQTLGGIVTALDTAQFQEQLQATGAIPGKYGVGLALDRTEGNGSRLVISADYVLQDWSTTAQEVDLLTESVAWGRYEAFRTGVAWTPSNPAQRKNAWGRTTYRVGAAQGTLGMDFEGVPLTYEAFTVGFSMPMVGSRSSSQFHFGTEIGTRYTGEGSLEENYIRLQFGFSLTPFLKNNWLVPRLYD